MKKFTLISLALLVVVPATMADIKVISGKIDSVDLAATSYGAVRFKDFTNSKDGYRSAGNLYLQDSAASLGVTPGLDGRARVQSGTDDGPLWRAGEQAFSFEYRPDASATDLILAKAGYLPSGALMTTPLTRVIDDPAKSVNFISFYMLNRTASSGDITLNLTDLDGNLLTPLALTLSAVGEANWYLTDPALLANGFILSGSINLANPRDSGETDKIDIAFGNATVVPAPGAALLALIGMPIIGWVKRRFA